MTGDGSHNSEATAERASLVDAVQHLVTACRATTWPLIVAVIGAPFAGYGAYSGTHALLASTGSTESAFKVAAGAVSLVVFGSMMVALLGTLRRMVLQKEPELTFPEIVLDGLGRLPRAAVGVLIVVVGQSILPVLPGIAAAALLPVPYVLATRRELSVPEAVRQGLWWSWRQPLTVVLGVAMLLFIGGFYYALVGYGLTYVGSILYIGMSSYAKSDAGGLASG